MGGSDFSVRTETPPLHVGEGSLRAGAMGKPGRPVEGSGVPAKASGTVVGTPQRKTVRRRIMEIGRDNEHRADKLREVGHAEGMD
jgi:hypothetical protein